MAEKKTKKDEQAEAADVEAVEETPAELEVPVEETPVAEEAPAAEEPATPAEPEAAAEPEATEPEAAPAEPEASAEPEAAEPEAEAPGAGTKRVRSNRHVPRSQRRDRSKPAREKPATRKPIVRLPKPEKELGRSQERRGVVVSDKSDKTIIVKVDVMKMHPRYKKVVRRSVKFHAHDEANSAGIGDTVRIVETRPLSKTKRWRLAEIVEKAR
jgi:ribosomal protein uS17